MGGFFGPFGGGAVGTGVVEYTVAAGDAGTLDPPGFNSNTGTLILTPNAANSEAEGLTAGYNGQWCAIVIEDSATGTMTLNVGTGFEGSGDLVLSAGQQCRAIYLTANSAWNIA